MNQTTEGQLVDGILGLLVFIAQLLVIRYHLKLPTVVQTLLDERVSAAAGGGTPTAVEKVVEKCPARHDCRPWLDTSYLPIVGQLNQVLPEGAETSTWYNDCGEACCASVITACRGTEIMPDMLRVSTFGRQGKALTNASDLVTILARYNVLAREAAYWGRDPFGPLMEATEDGRPVIALGTWPTPGGVLHWLLVYELSNQRVKYMNPWGPAWSWLSYEDWLRYSAHVYVEVKDHILYGDEIHF